MSVKERKLDTILNGENEDVYGRPINLQTTAEPTTQVISTTTQSPIITSTTTTSRPFTTTSTTTQVPLSTTTEPPTIVPTTPIDVVPTTPIPPTTPSDESTTPEAFDEDDDSDMPTQESKTYKTYLILKPLFKKLIGEMPYTTEFGYRGYPGIRVYALKDIINAIKPEKIDVNLMNVVIGIIASGPYSVVKKFMSYIEDTSKQQELWMVVQDV